MMVEWLAKYRLSAADELSSGEDASNCVGEAFSKDDFGIQRDLIDMKQIFSMENKKFKNVHLIADLKLVEEFDP
jgi:hypothetical protein